jgi:hypothetical protein
LPKNESSSPSLESLDAYLSTRRIVSPPGVCSVCLHTPPEFLTLIDQRAWLKAWTAFATLLTEWGAPTNKDTLKQHYYRHGPEGWDVAKP